MQGTITYWNKNRAFGFIRTIAGGKQESYFLHINEITEGPLVPSVGDTAVFEAVPAASGKKCGSAVSAKLVGGAK